MWRLIGGQGLIDQVVACGKGFEVVRGEERTGQLAGCGRQPVELARLMQSEGRAIRL